MQTGVAGGTEGVTRRKGCVTGCNRGVTWCKGGVTGCKGGVTESNRI